MINSKVLAAKVERNGLKRYARNYFRDETSDIIRSLRESGKEVLVGIQKNERIYTILGNEKVYYSTKTGEIGEISISSLIKLLHENSMRKGRWGRYKYIKTKNGHEVWIKDSSTMESLWNVLLWLEQSA